MEVVVVVAVIVVAVVVVVVFFWGGRLHLYKNYAEGLGAFGTWDSETLD